MKNLQKWQKRCEDCACLKKINGTWCCDECFNQHCEDIDDCPLGITFEQIVEIEQATKENKVKLNAKSEKPKERKPREKKLDEDKVSLIKQVSEILEGSVENLQITNVTKIIEFDYNGSHYKLDLIKQRKPK